MTRSNPTGHEAPTSDVAVHVNDGWAVRFAQSTDALIRAGLATGDVAALGALYDRDGPQSFAVARRMLGDAQRAENVVASVFAALWREGPTLDRNSESLRESIVQRVREECRARLDASTTGEPLDRVGTVRRDLVALADSDGALAGLTGDAGRVLRLALVSRWTVRQIAAGLALTAESVHASLRIGLDTLIRQQTREAASLPPRDLSGSEGNVAAHFEAEGSFLALLNAVGDTFVSDPDFDGAVKQVARLAVPAAADFCFFDVVTDDGGLKRVAWAHADPLKRALFDDVWRYVPTRDFHKHPVAKVLATGEPELGPTITDTWMRAVATSPDHLRFLQELNLQSVLTVPLIVQGRRLGALTTGFSTRSGRSLGRVEVEVARDVAREAARALEAARLNRESRELEWEAARMSSGFQSEIKALRDFELARHEYLQGSSHDIKKALTSVKGRVQFAQRKLARDCCPVDVTAREDLAIVDETLSRIVPMIGNLQSLGQDDIGRILALNLQPTDLLPLIHRLVADQRGGTESHRLVVDATTAEVFGFWDPARIERVIRNLLANAVKYSPAGGTITVSIGCEGGERDPWAVLVVSDEGIGIPSADLPRIFARFHRGGNVVGKIGGTGIGLTTVKQIVEQHGGTIAVTSEVDHGTSFTVRLPRPSDKSSLG